MVATAAMLFQPWEYVVVDIETAAAKPEDVEAEFRRIWSPDKRWKDETIIKRYREALAKAEERGALADTAPIVAIALKSNVATYVLHTLDVKRPASSRPGVAAIRFPTETEMLIGMAGIIDQNVGPDTLIAGFNIRSFDLPKVRLALARNQVRIPSALVSREQPSMDLMIEFCQRYSVTRETMIALEVVLQCFGIPNHKRFVDSPLIPDLVARGEGDLILDYSVLDILSEEAVLLAMLGHAAAPANAQTNS